MEQVFEFLKGFNFQTIGSLAIITWYFSRHMENKINKIENELKELIKIQSCRSDQLYQMFIDLLREKR